MKSHKSSIGSVRFAAMGDDGEEQPSETSDVPEAPTKKDQRLRFYRKQVSQLHSRVSGGLLIAVTLMVAIFLANISVTFYLVTTGLSTVSKAYISVANVSDARTQIPSSTLLVQSLRLALANSDNASAAAARHQLEAVSKHLEAVVTHMCIQLTRSRVHIFSSAFFLHCTADVDAAPDDLVPFDLWTTLSHTVSFYNPYAHSYSTMNFSLFQIVNEFKRSAFSLAAFDNFTTEESVIYDADVRFVLDNGRNETRMGFDELLVAYTRATLRYLKHHATVLIALCPSTVSLILLSMVLLVGISVYILHSERVGVLKLFTSISMAVAVQVFTECGGSQAEADEIVLSTKTDVPKKPAQYHSGAHRSLLVKVAVCTLVLVAFILTLSIYGIVTMNSFSDPVTLSVHVFEERTYLRRCHVLATALLNGDTTTFGSIFAIRDLMHTNIMLYWALKALEQKHSQRLINYQDMRYLLLEKNCTNLAGTTIGYCAGLDSLDLAFLQHVKMLHDANDSFCTTSNPDWTTLHLLEFQGVFPWHAKLEEQLLQHNLSVLRIARVVVNVVFSVAWPASVLVYLVLYFPLQKIRVEHLHAIKMLLLLPVEIIESTPTIKYFLETGTHRTGVITTSTQEHDRSFIDKAIQSYDVASIVYCTTTYTIEACNPLAEKLFQWSCADMIGMAVTQLLTFVPNTTSFDGVGINKDGMRFPVAVITRSGLTKGVSIACIQDIRPYDWYKVLLSETDTMASKIVPRSQITVFRQFLVDPHTEDNFLFSLSHSASALIAEVIDDNNSAAQFLSKNSLQLLHTLISTWDALAQQANIEKITSSEDITYVCGCPEEVQNHATMMVRFGAVMMRELQRFNHTNRKHLRVTAAISSGPMSAGLIGFARLCWNAWGPAVISARDLLQQWRNSSYIVLTPETRALVGETTDLVLQPVPAGKDPPEAYICVPPGTATISLPTTLDDT
eukprot:TRINITY_DN2340_c0_g1_i1.p1 TRINITY_DN2340_c0_g1~~TRINITY_DN2340_c0_g1_i1.p1  ORF type:complete len:1016 (-),score=163.52 TRINITY_DN2340_c0_g1_i1:1502-4372(-)